MFYLLLTLVPVAFFVGFYLREVLDIIRKIEQYLRNLRLAQSTTPPPPPRANFAEPMNRVELAAELERERIEALN